MGQHPPLHDCPYIIPLPAYLQPTVESFLHYPLYGPWRVTSPRSPTAHRHCWQLPFQVLAFAMIASESDKRLGWFRFVWQHGHVPLHHKYEPLMSVIVWSRMRTWPDCVQSTQYLFQNDWKVFENFKDKFKYFFSTEHEEETKLNSTGHIQK